MFNNNPTARIRLTALGVLLVALLTSGMVYAAQTNHFAPITPTSPSKVTFTNPEILLNWMPASSYDYTVARINDYLQTNGILSASSMTVTSSVTFSTPTYDFTANLVPRGGSLHVVATVTNTSGVLSTAVSINGQPQDLVIPSNNNGAATSYTGVSALIDNGLSAIQSNEFEQAMQKFAPGASSIAIDGTSIRLGSASSPQSYNFILTLDGKPYSATLDAIGILRAQLYLYDPSNGNHRVFDSGIMSQGS